MTKPPKPILKVHRGRPRSIEPQVLLWRKKTKKFLLLKGKILKVLADRDWTPEQIKTFLTTPIPRLKNRTPRQLIAARNNTALALLLRFVVRSVV